MAEALNLNKLGKRGLVNNYLRRRWQDNHDDRDPMTDSLEHQHDWFYLVASAMVLGLAVIFHLTAGQAPRWLLVIGAVLEGLVGTTSALICVGSLVYLTMSAVRPPHYRRFAELLAQVAEHWLTPVEHFADWPAEKLHEEARVVLIALATEQLRLQRDCPSHYGDINKARAAFQRAYDVFRALSVVHLGEDWYHQEALDSWKKAEKEKASSQPGDQASYQEALEELRDSDSPADPPPPLVGHS